MISYRHHGGPANVMISGDRLFEWYQEHTYFAPGYKFNPRYKAGRWDGKRSPGTWMPGGVLSGSFGLLQRVLQDAGEPPPLYAGVQGMLVAAERFAHETPEFEKLRDYQRNAFELVVRNGWGRVAYATNAGKGAVIALLARFAVSIGKRALILCDERAVFDALVGEVRTWGQLEPDLMKAGAPKQPASNPSPVTIAMVPTLEGRIKESKAWLRWMQSHEMVLIDEADKADAPRWKHVLRECSQSVWRAGFSGSFPTHEHDDLQLDELMGPIVARVRNEEMVERGVSARPEIEVHGFDSTPYIGAFPHDYRQWDPIEMRTWAYERVVFENAHRHLFIASLIRPDTPTVIIVTRVEHGKVLAATLPNSAFLSGADSDKERLAVLEMFQRKELQVLVVTKILDRGTNRLGQAVDLIFASSEGSTSQVLQRIGRGLRRAGGKEFLRLVDIVDHVGTDHPDVTKAKIASSFFVNAARKRLTVYATEGFDVTLVPYAQHVQGGLLSHL